MKTSMSKKLLSLFIAVVFCATTFAISEASADKAYAEEGVSLVRDTVEMNYYPKWKVGNTEWLAEPPDVEIDLGSVQSTDPEVASVIFDEHMGDGGAYLIKTKKAGSATLTFNAAPYGTGDWVQTSVNVISRKWVRPCATFKIGSKYYTKKFTNKFYYSISKKVSGKLYVKARKGWKLINITKSSKKTYEQKDLKNRQKVTLTKRYCLIVSFKKKGTDIHRYVYLDCNY